MSDQPLFFRPSILLRTEAFIVLVTSCAVYNYWFPHHWALFACLFLVPDISLIAYIRGPASGASVIYNLFHSYMLPALLGAISLYLGSYVGAGASLIWIGHIGLDRTLGYGLKHPNSFSFTHIQSAAFTG